MPVDVGGAFGSGGVLEGLGDILGKPDTAAIDDIAEQLEAITRAEQARRLQLQEPLRQTLFGGPEGEGDLGTFLTTGELPVSLRTPFTATQEAIAEQGQNVRQDIVSRVGARGGQLRNLLTRQRLSEARQQAQLPLLEQPLRNALFQQALGTAVGQEFPIVSGFGTAGNLLGLSGHLDLAFKEQARETGQAFGLGAAGGG